MVLSNAKKRTSIITDIASGTSVDWMASEGVPYSMVMELQDKGARGFFVPEEDIHKAVSKLFKRYSPSYEIILPQTHSPISCR